MRIYVTVTVDLCHTQEKGMNHYLQNYIMAFSNNENNISCTQDNNIREI